MKRKVLAAVILTLASITLVGCSASSGDNILPPSDFGYDYRVMDAVELQQNLGSTTFESPFANISDAQTLNVFTGGSSSCPPTISSIDDTDSGAIQIKLASNTGPCTMDYVPFGFQITAIKTNFDFSGKTVYLCQNGTCNGVPIKAS